VLAAAASCSIFDHERLETVSFVAVWSDVWWLSLSPRSRAARRRNPSAPPLPVFLHAKRPSSAAQHALGDTRQ